MISSLKWLKWTTGALLAGAAVVAPQLHAAAPPADSAHAAAGEAADAAEPMGNMAEGAPVPLPPTVSDAPRDDDAFLQLRDAARRDDAEKADFYANRLASYLFQDYVDYYRLKPRIRELSDEPVRGFLQRYQGSAIADRLRNDWLLELGRRRDWVNFDAQFPLYLVADDLQVKCYALLSRVMKGQRVAAEARLLLTNPGSYGEACGALVTALFQSTQFDADDLWAQVRLAGEFDATGPARRIILLLGGSDAKIAQAIDTPAVALARGMGSSRADHETYVVAIGRMSKTSVKLAVLALNKVAAKLTPQEQAIAWANIALRSSYSLSPDTSEYWAKSNGAPLSLDQMQWKTRFALRNEDWRQVRANIEAMPAALRDDPTWVYWLARSMQAQARGQATPEALALYRSIAELNSFYGLLAAEELGRRVTIPPPGPAISAAEVAFISSNPGFQRAIKFFAMRLRFEGTREWNWELRKLNERQYLAAAEFARQNNILDRMVNTSERAKVEIDYTQRYPSPHNDIMHPATQTLGLDKAWVYGVIRQESRFIMDAQSSVGAAGLMQVMPSTGRYVAKKIGLTDFVQDMLSDVRTNILLGTNYMNMVIGGLDGSQILATAAYNAGPGRLRGWRATMTRPMEGAIFAESIPYSETRTYVKNVMANATFYAALFENRPQSLKARLGTVLPKGYGPAPADAPPEP